MGDKALLFSLLTALIWGLAPAFEKVGLSGKIDPYVGVVLRTVPIMTVGVIGLFVMGRVQDVASVSMKSVIYVMIGGLLAGFVGQFAFYSALKAGESSRVVSLAATYPLVALTVSVVFLGESFSWQKLAGIIMVVGGVVLLK